MAALAAAPPDIHRQLLSAVCDFADLRALVLTARPLHVAFSVNRKRVLSSVAHNFLGGIFTDALLLARGIEKRDGLLSDNARKTKGLSATTVRLLVKNADMVEALQQIVFGLLKTEDKLDIYSKRQLAKFVKAPPVVTPSETEALRFKRAAYRFCVFCLFQTAEGRIAFLNRFPTIQILELAHFVSGLSTLVYAIRGQPHDSEDDSDFVSSVLSTGVSNILALWDLKIDYNDAQKTPDQPRSHWYSYTNADLKAELAAEFKSALASAGAHEGASSFFRHEFLQVVFNRGVQRDLELATGGEAILDGGNAKMGRVLARLELELELQKERELEEEKEGKGKGKGGVGAIKAKRRTGAGEDEDPFVV